MLRRIAAAAVAVHGLVHLIGFVVPWRLLEVAGFAYRTTALNGTLALGDAGARAVGVAWLVLAAGFVAVAIGIWRAQPWALPLVGALAAASIVVCVLGLPDAAAGIAVNVAILAAVGYVTAQTRRSVAR